MVDQSQTIPVELSAAHVGPDRRYVDKTTVPS